jgi:hypothetical protein
MSGIEVLERARKVSVDVKNSNGDCAIVIEQLNGTVAVPLPKEEGKKIREIVMSILSKTEWQ